MNKWLLLPTVLVIALIIWTATTQIMKETILSEAQISSRVETFYNGQAKSVLKKGEQYFVTFTTEEGVYEVAVDEENGRFSQLSLLKEIQPPSEQSEKPAPTEQAPTPAAPEVTPQKPQEEAKPTQQIRLTTQQIRALAQKQYTGEIEDIAFHSTSTGGYYLVEIDAEEDVTLQIHAVTGKVLSVSFED